MRDIVGLITQFATVLRTRWLSWTLAKKFAVCASLVLLPAMLAMGQWVSDTIVESSSQSAGTSAALYMENFVEPLVQELAANEEISAPNLLKLSRLLDDTSLGQKVLSFKIWGPMGTVVASNRAGLIGQQFPLTPRQKRAWNGLVAVEFEAKASVENEVERRSKLPLLEVYVPLRARGTERVVAVGEFYEIAHELSGDLTRARVWSWVVVAGITISMLSALFAIVQRGSTTIEAQQIALQQRIAELTVLLDENRRLRRRVNEASERATQSNENYLRRLGADLHDGPAQLLSVALLRLQDTPPLSRDQRGPAVTHPPTANTAPGVRDVLNNALRDIRNIAAGLALPEIESKSFADAIALAVRRHEELTRTTVKLRFGPLPSDVNQSIKLCAYRFVQEGLSNAFRHGGGIGQSVVMTQGERSVEMAVSDDGPGIENGAAKGHHGLGLRGLTDRIESLGGVLTIETAEGKGTRLFARLPIRSRDAIHAAS